MQGQDLTACEKREAGNMDNYIKDGKGYKCKGCDAVIMSARVAHPIYLREMPPRHGFGRCAYEQVPYCPNCDEKPNFDGEPVYVSKDDQALISRLSDSRRPIVLSSVQN